MTDEQLRIYPKIRNIPEKKPKSFVLFPFEMWEKRREPFESKESESLDLTETQRERIESFLISITKLSEGNEK